VYGSREPPSALCLRIVVGVGCAGLARRRAYSLPGGNSRLDYASLDSARGLLFVAHLGASQVLEINIRTGRVLCAIGGLSQVHGVLVVPSLHRVHATGDRRQHGGPDQ
jgi:hypothetical protein